MVGTQHRMVESSVTLLEFNLRCLNLDSCVSGSTGLKGDIGLGGSTGERGTGGETGATGNTGPQGLKGDVGDGETGSTGYTGKEGETGEELYIYLLKYIYCYFIQDKTYRKSLFYNVALYLQYKKNYVIKNTKQTIMLFISLKLLAFPFNIFRLKILLHMSLTTRRCPCCLRDVIFFIEMPIQLHFIIFNRQVCYSA